MVPGIPTPRTTRTIKECYKVPNIEFFAQSKNNGTTGFCERGRVKRKRGIFYADQAPRPAQTKDPAWHRGSRAAGLYEEKYVTSNQHQKMIKKGAAGDRIKRTTASGQEILNHEHRKRPESGSRAACRVAVVVMRLKPREKQTASRHHRQPGRKTENKSVPTAADPRPIAVDCKLCQFRVRKRSPGARLGFGFPRAGRHQARHGRSASGVRPIGVHVDSYPSGPMRCHQCQEHDSCV